MKLVGIRTLKINEVLSTPIKMADGRILLPAGARLTENYIERLKKIGIYSVYIDDELFSDVQVTPAVEDDTKTEALKVIGKIYKAAEKDKAFNDSEAKAVVKRIIQDVRSIIGNPINLFNTYMIEDERCIHAVNVAIISAAMGMSKGYSPDLLEDIVVGAYLHDVKLNVMTEDETDKDHPKAGMEYLKAHRQISARSYMTVYQHHESYDGAGFPRAVKGDEIYEGALLVRAADLYDSLVSGCGRKERMLPHQAFEFMTASAWKLIDNEMLQHFNNTMTLYPTGADVQLSSGEKAVVIRQNPRMPLRPVVRVLGGGVEPVEYDLLNNLTLFIDKVALE